MHPLLNEEIEIIRRRPEHEAFIFSSWLNTMTDKCSWASKLGKRFRALHHPVVERILDKSIVLVATKRDDPNIAFGYIVAEESAKPPAVHFIFVKPVFRRMGVGKILIHALNWDLNKAFYTHSVGDMTWLLSKYPGLKYYPHLV